MIRDDNIQRARQIIEKEYGCTIFDITRVDGVPFVSFMDSKGYKYYTNYLNIVYKYEIFPFHRDNIYGLENISLFLSGINSNYELLEDNIYENNTTNLNLVCKICGETVYSTWGKLKYNNPKHTCFENKEYSETKIQKEKIYQKNFAESFPDLLFDWDYQENGDPRKYFPFSKARVSWICRICGHKWKTTIKNRTGNSAGTGHRSGCPVCESKKSESSYQNKTREFLETLGYVILHERECSLMPLNPKSGRTLMYDNEIKELKFLIEVNGDHHYNRLNGYHTYQAKRKGTTRDDEFAYQVYKDNYKEQYALENGYFYLALPYTEFDNEETYKHTILNAIDFILNTR